MSIHKQEEEVNSGAITATVAVTHSPLSSALGSVNFSLGSCLRLSRRTLLLVPMNWVGNCFQLFLVLWFIKCTLFSYFPYFFSDLKLYSKKGMYSKNCHSLKG